MTAFAVLPALFTFLAVLSGCALLVLVYLDNRKARIDDSIAAFRRHIDALSPESRRGTVVRDSHENHSR